MKSESLLSKIADIPKRLKKPTVPVSKEYDAVAYVYNDMRNHQIESIPWSQFQKRYQQFAQKYTNLFTEIRHNSPHVTQADLKTFLDDMAAKAKPGYDIEYSTYDEPEHSYRAAKQMVLRLNRGADAERILAEDPLIAQYVDMVGQSSEMSGHPAGRKTVGWLRVDFIDKDWLLVDEVQSDLVNSIVQAQSILRAESFEEFIEGLTNPKVRQLALEKVSPERYTAVRQHFINSGYTSEKLEDIKSQLVALFKDWAEYALASLIEIARKAKIKNVAIHTAESISQRDEAVDAPKVRMYYDNLAKSFGFKEQVLDVAGLHGNFWVRTAGVKSNLRDPYSRPKEWFKAALLRDFGEKEAGLYSIEDLDRYDSQLSYELMGLHDTIHLNPVRGVIPDYQDPQGASSVWRYTYGAVKEQLLPAVVEASKKCSSGVQQQIKVLVDAAVAALSASLMASRKPDYREAGIKVETAFSRLHSAVEAIRVDTRKGRGGKKMPMEPPKGMGDYT